MSFLKGLSFAIIYFRPENRPLYLRILANYEIEIECYVKIERAQIVETDQEEIERVEI